MKNILPIIVFSIIMTYMGMLTLRAHITTNTPQTKEPSLVSLLPKELLSTPANNVVTTAPKKNTAPVVKPTTPKTTPTIANEYTMTQVMTHNSSTSCWTVVSESVYDVTSFINKHPGGSGAIKSLCGKDGTSSFENQHDGQRRPEQELASLKIGTLKQS